MGAEVVITGDTGAGMRFREVRGIAFDAELHVAGVESDDAVRVGGGVVQELDDGLHGVFRWC